MLKKDREAQKAAVDDYFQHWDNKDAKSETEATRAVSKQTNTFCAATSRDVGTDILRQARTAEYESITRQYVPDLPPKSRRLLFGIKHNSCIPLLFLP
jgi:hypothetical protein